MNWEHRETCYHVRQRICWARLGKSEREQMRHAVKGYLEKTCGVFTSTMWVTSIDALKYPVRRKYIASMEVASFNLAQLTHR